MHYIVFDLEWNQRTGTRQQPMPGLPFEIIEIGAIQLDRAGRIISRFSEMVSPVVYLEMSIYTEQVTHMNMKELRQGRPFAEVAREFFEWCGEYPCFCTWGPSDLEVLQQNMAFFGVDVELPSPLVYYDVQKLYSLEFQDGKDRRALEDAVVELNITHGDDFHRALQDAYYTACVWKKLSRPMKRFFSIDYYHLPDEHKKIWSFDFGTYIKQISRPYPKKTGAIYDKEIRRRLCPKCNLEMQEVIPWFPIHQKLCASLTECAIHGLYQSKLRIRQDKDSQYFAIKTLKAASEDRRERIKTKYESFLKAEEVSQQKRKGNRNG